MRLTTKIFLFLSAFTAGAAATILVVTRMGIPYEKKKKIEIKVSPQEEKKIEINTSSNAPAPPVEVEKKASIQIDPEEIDEEEEEIERRPRKIIKKTKARTRKSKGKNWMSFLVFGGEQKKEESKRKKLISRTRGLKAWFRSFTEGEGLLDIARSLKIDFIDFYKEMKLQERGVFWKSVSFLLVEIVRLCYKLFKWLLRWAVYLVLYLPVSWLLTLFYTLLSNPIYLICYGVAVTCYKVLQFLRLAGWFNKYVALLLDPFSWKGEFDKLALWALEHIRKGVDNVIVYIEGLPMRIQSKRVIGCLVWLRDLLDGWIDFYRNKISNVSKRFMDYLSSLIPSSIKKNFRKLENFLGSRLPKWMKRKSSSQSLSQGEGDTQKKSSDLQKKEDKENSKRKKQKRNKRNKESNEEQKKKRAKAEYPKLEEVSEEKERGNIVSKSIDDIINRQKANSGIATLAPQGDDDESMGGFAYVEGNKAQPLEILTGLKISGKGLSQVVKPIYEDRGYTYIPTGKKAEKKKYLSRQEEKVASIQKKMKNRAGIPKKRGRGAGVSSKEERKKKASSQHDAWKKKKKAAQNVTRRRGSREINPNSLSSNQRKQAASNALEKRERFVISATGQQKVKLPKQQRFAKETQDWAFTRSKEKKKKDLRLRQINFNKKWTNRTPKWTYGNHFDVYERLIVPLKMYDLIKGCFKEELNEQLMARFSIKRKQQNLIQGLLSSAKIESLSFKSIEAEKQTIESFKKKDLVSSIVLRELTCNYVNTMTAHSIDLPQNEKLSFDYKKNKPFVVEESKIRNAEYFRKRRLAIEKAQEEQQKKDHGKKHSKKKTRFPLQYRNPSFFGDGISSLFKKIGTFKKKVKYISWSPDGSHLAVLYKDDTLIIYDSSFKVAKTLKNVYNISWSPDGSHFAAAHTDATLIIYDRSFKAVAKLPKNKKKGYWSPDGSHLAAVHTDGTLIIYDRSFKVAKTIKKVLEIYWSPDNSHFAAYGDGTLIIYDRSFDRRNQNQNLQQKFIYPKHVFHSLIDENGLMADLFVANGVKLQEWRFKTKREIGWRHRKGATLLGKDKMGAEQEWSEWAPYLTLAGRHTALREMLEDVIDKANEKDDNIAQGFSLPSRPLGYEVESLICAFYAAPIPESLRPFGDTDYGTPSWYEARKPNQNSYWNLKQQRFRQRPSNQILQ